jgi:hypothetical protein
MLVHDLKIFVVGFAVLTHFFHSFRKSGLLWLPKSRTGRLVIRNGYFNVEINWNLVGEVVTHFLI